MEISERRWRGSLADLLSLVAIGFPLVLLAAATALLADGDDFHRSVAIVGDILSPPERAMVAALLTTMLCVIMAVCIAAVAVGPILAGDVGAVRQICLCLPFAIVPLFLGPVAFGFLWRDVHLQLIHMVLGPSFHSTTGLIIIDVSAQLLRYVPLLAWLLTTMTLGVDSTTIRYARIIGMTRMGLIRAQLFPSWTIISLVVGAFAFQDAANDVIITYLALRPSPAAGTELTAHLLSRLFLTASSGLSAQAAISSVLVVGTLVGCSMLLIYATLASAVGLLVRRGSRLSETHGPFGSRRDPRYGKILPAALCLLIYAPLIHPLVKSPWAINELLPRLGLTLIAALIVAVLAWISAMILMFGLCERARLGHALRRLVAAGSIAMALGFFPAIGLGMATYAVLFAVTGPSGEIFGWLVAQILKLLPAMAVFSIPLVAALASRRLDYGRISGLRFHDRLRHELLQPAYAVHFALIIVGWNMVINESVIASVFQSDMPSFAELVLRAVSGRSAAYGTAAALIIVQIMIFGLLCFLWGDRSFREWRRRHAVDHL